MSLLLQINPSDNVAVARQPIAAGTVLETGPLATDVPAGHKIALRPIPAGGVIRKYGFAIGLATRDIAAGEHVHEHNVRSGLGADTVLAYTGSPSIPADRAAASLGPATFLGYRRPDGSVGTRNELWIINTVACVNVPAERIARLAAEKFVRPGSNIDGVQSFSHPYGCSQLGDDLVHTQKILAGLARHPNAGAVLVLGLGCENNQMRAQLEAIGATTPGRIQFFNAQEVGDEIEEGLVRMEKLAAYAGRFKREPVPVSSLVLGMKCGGSDGFSGITANPLVGRVSDWLTAAGGTAILTEVPEMFGAEEPLLSRAASREVFDQGLAMINGFKDYFRSHNEPIGENPSPGNRAGGITTLEDKSLGCVQKGGRASIAQIAGYGDPAKPGLGGLCLVNAPGNDGVSCTAMTAAGAHAILFTTGRGTPLGVPVPTIKIASNHDLAERKKTWIDFDASPVLTPGVSIDEVARELIATVIAIASGQRQARNEINGFREITLWKDGVTL
ncbi:MAG: altronate dehydratase [Verrucomicrobia bacterium]|nr:altronate dehydratase [Verrucomicrobiota bacterium]